MPKKKKEKIENEGPIDHYGLFLSNTNRSYGKGTITDAVDLKNPDPNFSGSFYLDIALQIPFPAGRIVEIYGPESVGKTSIGLEVLGQALARGKRVALFKVERSLQRTLIDGVGTIDVDKRDDKDRRMFQIIKSRNGEEILDILIDFVGTVHNAVVLFDSVDAILSEDELNKSIGDATVAKRARLMSSACRKLDAACDDTGTTVIFVNQLRKDIAKYHTPDTTSGGNALPYYASQRIELKNMRKDDMVKDSNGDIIGHNARYHIRKNKVAPAHIQGEIRIIYGKGIHREMETSRLLRDLALVEMSKDNKGINIEGKIRGVNEAAELFGSDVDLFRKYASLVMSNYFDWDKCHYEI